jgi:hypothetical protein
MEDGKVYMEGTEKAYGDSYEVDDMFRIHFKGKTIESIYKNLEKMDKPGDAIMGIAKILLKYAPRPLWLVEHYIWFD